MRLGAHVLATTAALALAAGAAATDERRPTSSTARSAFCSGVDEAELKRPSVFRYGLTGSELQSQFFDQSGLNGDGYRPRRITGYRAGSEQLFATKWVKASGPRWTARFGLTGEKFNALYLQLRGTHRPVDVSGYNTPGGQVRHAVIWERNTSRLDWRVHRDVSRPGMDDLVDQYAKTGFIPLRVEAYTKSGQLRYVSLWVKTPCNWRMHNLMTLREFQGRLTAYGDTHRLVHQDAFVQNGTVYYAGIWWKQPGKPQIVQSDRDWYVFQRQFNNNACIGAVIDNFYATDVPGAIRYGAIWTQTGTQSFGPSLEARIARELNCVPGRGGAAVINVSTGQQVLLHADASYGTSSTIKSAILYALLRKIDATPDTLDTLLAAGTQYGTNQGGTLASRRSYPLRTFATTMIDDSNNWATNRLIDYVGLARINSELTSLGLDGIKLQRYMTGTGAPSAHGTTGSSGDYGAGFDNTASPRHYATFLRLMHEIAGKLSRTSYAFYWSTLGLNGNAHDAVLDAGVASDRTSIVTIFEKSGSNTWTTLPKNKPQIAGRHYQRSAAGRLVFANGQVVVYAAFVDEGTSSSSTPLQNMLDCVVLHAVRQYSGKTTGPVVPACLGD